MAKRKSKTMAIAIILLLAFSAIAMILPVYAQKTTITLQVVTQNQLGINSPCVTSVLPQPNSLNPLLVSPAYAGKTEVWANATATFIRPDNTTVVINGPFKTRPNLVQGHQPDIYIIFTPDMKGQWYVNFYWPGDDTYEAANQTEPFPFPVGDHFPPRDSWAFLAMRPYPVVGLGQDLLINAWVSPPPINNHAYYEGYLFTFTSPSGSSFTVGPMDSELPATVWFDLPLTELGNWTVKFEFPGDWITKACSVTRTITVQEEWTLSYPDTPLPTEPWRFPINVENREWRNIAGPWYWSYYNCSGGAWNPYTEAPRTAHVLWKLPAYSGLGGFIGSPHSIQTGGGEEAYGAGDAGMYSSSVPRITTVMAGRGYYTAGGMIHCVDMFTGEELWAVEGTFDLGTRRGRTAALYDFSSTRFVAYDAITGATILDVPGMSLTQWVDPYALTVSGGFVIKWDTSSSTSNFESRIVWNVSNYLPSTSRSYSVISGDDIWLARFSQPYTVANVIVNNVTGLNLTSGEYMYSYNPYTPSDPGTWYYRQGPAIGAGYGLVYFAGIPHPDEGRGYQYLDAKTGDLIMTSEQVDYPWGNFWAYSPQACAYGMNFGLGYSGVWAFNMTNAQIVWHYIDDDTYNEEPYESNIVGSDAYPNNLNLTEGDTYASYAFGSTGPIVGGGIVFAPNTEHSPTFVYRGQKLNAIDAFTGEKVWSIIGVYRPDAIAYGILLADDSYNGFTYAFGKGTTATSLSFQNDVIEKGSGVLLKGSVLDTSPAQEGTAAVSDADQTAWMEYLHMQQPYPVSATGVSVSLDALDPNNNYVHLGDATSDLTGQYSFGWKPDLEGKYTIVASFLGSEAYYGSTAEAAILVTEAPAATAEPTPTPATAPLTDPYMLGIGVAVIIALVIVALLLVLLLRKR